MLVFILKGWTSVHPANAMQHHESRGLGTSLFDMNRSYRLFFIFRLLPTD